MVEGVHAPVSIRGLLSARLPAALVDDTHRRRRACKRPLPHYLREGGPRDYGYTDLNLRAEANFQASVGRADINGLFSALTAPTGASWPGSLVSRYAVGHDAQNPRYVVFLD